MVLDFKDEISSFPKVSAGKYFILSCGLSSLVG